MLTYADTCPDNECHVWIIVTVCLHAALHRLQRVQDDAARLLWVAYSDT